MKMEGRLVKAEDLKQFQIICTEPEKGLGMNDKESFVNQAFKLFSEEKLEKGVLTLSFRKEDGPKNPETFGTIPISSDNLDELVDLLGIMFQIYLEPTKPGLAA